MSRKNKNGISDYIPESDLRKIRKASGYACVICGDPFYTIEHIDPEFHEMTEKYDPSKHEACLLCMNHQMQKNAKALSKVKVKSAMKNPKSLQDGFSSCKIDFGEDGLPTILLGNQTFRCIEIIRIYDEPILKIEPPKEEGQPFLLTARIYNNKGELLLEVDKNQLKNYIGDWEIIKKSNIFTFKEKDSNHIYLIFELCPPLGIRIHELDFYYKGRSLQIKSDGCLHWDTNSMDMGLVNMYGGIYFSEGGVVIGFTSEYVNTKLCRN